MMEERKGEYILIGNGEKKGMKKKEYDLKEDEINYGVRYLVEVEEKEIEEWKRIKMKKLIFEGLEKEMKKSMCMKELKMKE